AALGGTHGAGSLAQVVEAVGVSKQDAGGGDRVPARLPVHRGGAGGEGGEVMSYPNAAVMAWARAGRPHRATLGVTAAAGVRAMCARHVEESAPARKWLEGKSFTDPAHLRARSDRVCEGCAWAVTGRGMDQVRMWTIVARTDRELPPSNPKAAFAAPHLHFTSRADMRVVVDTLADPPEGEWVVSVAESGQKHSLPYAVVNRGRARWRVRMDA